MTDYQFASDNPTSKIELDGLEGVSINQGYVEGLLWQSTGITNDEVGKQMAVDVTKTVVKELSITAVFFALPEVAGVALEVLLPEAVILSGAGAEAVEVGSQGARAAETAASRAGAESFAQGSDASNGARMVEQPPTTGPPTFSGTAKPMTDGATPNSVYTHLSKDGKALQNAAYDQNGDVISHVDFKNHGPGAPSGHGHEFPQPGNPASGHGAGKPHIPNGDLPLDWKKLPPGVQPHTPIGQ